MRKPRLCRVGAEMTKALLSPALRARYAAIETEPVGGTPEWADVAKKSGAKSTNDRRT